MAYKNRGLVTGAGWKNRGSVITGGSFTNRGAEDQSGRPFQNRGQDWFGGDFKNRGQSLLTSASSWTPASLFASSEVGVWYDPSDLTTMFQDSAGTTPVTATGDPVGLILDKSGNNKHASQATAALRPVLRESGGLYYLDFDGTDDLLNSSIIDKTAWTDCIAITGSLSDAGEGSIVDGLDNSGSNNHEPYSDNNWYCAFGGSTRLTASTIAYAAANVLTRKHLSGTTSFRKNGVAVGTPTAQTTNFGGNAAISFGGPAKLNGRIYSILIRAATWTTEEVEAAESYVAGKSGVTL